MILLRLLHQTFGNFAADGTVSPGRRFRPEGNTEFQFKAGKATKAWLGIGTIEAPTVVKGAIWTAAQLEDTFGIVHGDLLREINKFVYERCPKRLEELK